MIKDLLRGAVVFLLGVVTLLIYTIYELSSNTKTTDALQILRIASLQTIHEIGFALIVAVVVWFVFEYFTHNKERQNNVDINSFGRNLPIELVNAATSLALDQNFVREKWECTFLLDTEDIEITQGNTEKFVILMCMTNYTVRNITKSPQYYQLSVAISGTRCEDLKHRVKIESFLLTKGSLLRPIDVTDANNELQRNLSEHRHQVSFGEELVNPGQYLNVALSYSKVKEASDTEIIAGRYPADSLKFTLVDRTNGTLRMDAAALVPLEAEKIDTPKNAHIKKYSIGRYLLPGQGFQFWWRVT